MSSPVSTLVALFMVSATTLAQAQSFTKSNRIPVSEATVQALGSTRAILLLDQENVVVSYSPVKPTGVSTAIAMMPGIGLLGAIMAGAAEGGALSAAKAKRVSEAQEQSDVIRNAFQGYDFKTAYGSALQAKLKEVNWLKVTELAYDKPTTKTEEIKSATAQSAILVLNSRYSLSPNGRYLRIWCAMALLANDEKLKEIAVRERPDNKNLLLYRNELLFIEAMPGTYKNLEDAVAQWSENGGEPLRVALDDGIQAIVHMMLHDLQLPQAGTPAGSAAPARTVRYEGQTATVLAETDKHLMLKLPNEALRIVSKSLTKE
jgi:hypothetical protein